jgi:hypothetical protein
VYENLLAAVVISYRFFIVCSILKFYSGWLLKQRRSWGIGPDWQQRWFVIDKGRFMWFSGDYCCVVM